MASFKAHLGLFSMLLFVLLFLGFIDVSLGKKRAVSIPDDLDDVVDDEEDEAWREWGRKKAKEEEGFKPPDLSKMNPMEIQAEMLKRHVGPAFGFVKLRLGISRTQEEITTTAMRWSKVLRTGSVEVKFMGVDLSTIMFTIERGQDIEELKEFVLSQPEAYEMKIGEQTFRRPGDPPLEEVIEMLRRKRNGDSTSDQQHPEDEL
ncbi:uncharacterized protein LOC109837547 isoform X1 [Asparagus officinalis]|uniref:uncharacterized protein LOC109837547 isoform X1 n=1 Tax=Asparagus officinalis TaxID=4686 RepID=UPI00098E7A6E|nr:uncharacterized protein LOC109837547 isoform X1 [Asparagus officinalis]